MTSESVAALRSECQAVAARLAAAVTPGERRLARDEIARLLDRVQTAVAELEDVRGTLARLVEQYQRLAMADEAEALRPGTTPPMRADHLGASTFIEKGWSLIALGDHAGAVAALTRALTLAPGDRHAEALLGWALMLHGRYDEALTVLSRVLAVEPENALARVNLGYVCLRKGIVGEAIEHLSRVLRDGSDRKAMLYANYYLGLVYLERGMFADAQAFFRQALTLGPNLHEASYDLGRAQWHAGDRDAARATWAAAAANGRLSAWGRRCGELLAAVDAGGEVPR